MTGYSHKLVTGLRVPHDGIMAVDFTDIDAQAIVDDMCAEFRQVDALLGSPKHGLPTSVRRYIDSSQSPPVFHMTRYFRNVTALDKYEACIERLDPFFIAVEHFTGKVQLRRTTGAELPKAYVDTFFCFTLADSFRSSLDIYSKFIGWFFDFKGKETMGFNYGELVKPLRLHSQRLADECNALRNSSEYALLKWIRDAEKHEGHGKTIFNLNETATSFSLVLRRPEPIDMANLELSAYVCLRSFLHLLHTTSVELERWPLGYPSTRDKVAEIDDEGYFRIPSVGPKST